VRERHVDAVRYSLQRQPGLYVFHVRGGAGCGAVVMMKKKMKIMMSVVRNVAIRGSTNKDARC
jgi:hypothetical protein